MNSEPLHNVLSDIAIPARARRGVVHDLLQERQRPRLKQLVSWAVLVENAADLPSAVFDLDRARPRGGRCRRGGQDRSVSGTRSSSAAAPQFASAPGAMPTGCSKRPTGERPIDELEDEVVSFVEGRRVEP